MIMNPDQFKKQRQLPRTHTAFQSKLVYLDVQVFKLRKMAENRVS